MSMIPPSIYPSSLRTVDLNMKSGGKIYSAQGDEWIKLVESKNLIDSNKNQGAYYLKLEDGKPGRFVSWIQADSSSASSLPGDKLFFLDVSVHEIHGRSGGFPLLAKMVRHRNNITHELLFVPNISPGGEIESVEILKDVEHSEIRRFNVRWENFKETLEGPEASYGGASEGFLIFMKNSFIISILAVIGQIITASLVAFGFARLQFKGREVLFVLLLATLMVPAQVTLIPLFSIYKWLGWIDTFLPLIVPHFTAGAFNVFLLRQYMLTLPKELDESASIDGCNVFQVYFKIILPNCMPALIVVGLFTFVWTWQDVMGPLIYLDSPELRTVPLGLEYFRSPYVDNSHLLMTGALLSMLPVAILFIIFQRYIMSGIATTGLK